MFGGITHPRGRYATDSAGGDMLYESPARALYKVGGVSRVLKLGLMVYNHSANAKATVLITQSFDGQNWETEGTGVITDVSGATIHMGDTGTTVLAPFVRVDLKVQVSSGSAQEWIDAEVRVLGKPT